MMYQFLDITSALPYRLLESLKPQRDQPIDPPQIEAEEQNRDQHHYGRAPHLAAIRPGGLAHLELDARIEFAQPRQWAELQGSWRESDLLPQIRFKNAPKKIQRAGCDFVRSSD